MATKNTNAAILAAIERIDGKLDDLASKVGDQAIAQAKIEVRVDAAENEIKTWRGLVFKAAGVILGAVALAVLAAVGLGG